jgi:putative selenate reductase
VDGEKFREITDSFDHVIVATGAHKPAIPPVQGKEWIIGGLDLLKAFNRGEKITIGPEVTVIGGGDVAIDGIEALVDLQIDPENITVIDIKTPSANPAERSKWEEAGVKFLFPLFLQEVTAKGLWVKNSFGRKLFLPGTAVAFINELPEMEFLPAQIKAQLDPRGFFISPQSTYLTVEPKVSIIGDATGLGLVANSIAKARNCAYQVNAMIQNIPYHPASREAIKPEELHLDWHLPLSKVDHLPLHEEHERCLHCGVCVLCEDCIKACPRQARTLNGDQIELNLNLCGGCGSCAAACRGGVIRMVPR